MPHTPGPWAVDAVMSERLHDIVLGYETPGKGNPILVATVYFEDRYTDDPVGPREADANAKLIAAAPELLKNIRAAYHALKSYAYGNAAPDLADEVAAACYKAITDATGETP